MTVKGGVRVALLAMVAGAFVVGGSRVGATPAVDAGVTLLRVPAGGIQPMAEIDEAGTIHLLFFAGEPMAGDVFYVTKRADSPAFSAPVRVNSQPGSVIAMGTVRGAQMALGRNGWVHVAWMGSEKAEPRGVGKQSPMLYARSAASGTGFEPQRSVVQHAVGLDGGGTLAADARGTVSVVWHAGAEHLGEEHRRVWVATSRDDGATFAREVAVTTVSAGVCGCCGMKAVPDGRGVLRVLYRAFSPPDHRDMYLLTSRGAGEPFDRRLLERWQIGACPMSTASAMTAGAETFIAWETNGEVAWARADHAASQGSPPISPPAPTKTRKHAAIAMGNGQVLLVWTEGMAWARGGTLHWRGYDRQGKPTALGGSAPGIPVWSRPAVIAHKQGGFTIVY